MIPGQPYRLAQGGLIDRSRELHFTFNGRNFRGYGGDTLASALLANGVRVVGRGFKFHRPRGILSAGVEEPNALVNVGHGAVEEPNVRATLQPVYDGLTARSQNCWPSVDFDLRRALDLLSGLWPAAFYQKTFMWPHWHCYEGLIRRTAGLGTLPPMDDPDRYLRRHDVCEVLVIGAGPSGLAAALAAGRAGRRVIVAEQGSALGGSLRWCPAQVQGVPAAVWIEQVCHELGDLPNVTVLTRSTVTACFDHNLLLVSEMLHDRDGARERLWKLRAEHVVLASGAIEQPLLFPGNDRPGIMLASAVERYLGEFAVACGRRVVIATNNDSAYPLARRLAEAGIELGGIIDCRRQTDGETAALLQGCNVPVFLNSVPLQTVGGRGVKRVNVGQRGRNDDYARVATLDCDCIAMAGGWQPTVHLLGQARGSLRFDAASAAFVPDRIPDHMRVAGACAGNFDLNDALREGWCAGGGTVDTAPCAGETRNQRLGIERVFIRHSRGRQWLDFQHDVTVRDIDIAVAENFSSAEHLKRFTTAGMSVDQGKTANLNTLMALAAITGRDPSEVGTTTFRPFFLPVTLGALAGTGRGEFYAPMQRSPVYAAHETLGAAFVDYAGYRRPAAYPRRDETLQLAIAREAIAARSDAVIFDGSPLGKIQIRGRDGAEFLNRVYVNEFDSLAPGRARYSLMLNENGVITADGIVARLAQDFFLVQTTSDRARQVFNWLEGLLQGEWPELDVLLTDVTGQWANIAVSGPRSRDLLQAQGLHTDFSDEAFPHMHIRETRLDGVHVRLLRTSFTGELGYECNVPADFGLEMWNRLLDSGMTVTPIGTGTAMLLRTEKGYLLVGRDTDGTTTPDDVGWGQVISRKQRDFLGKRSLSRLHNRRPGRLQFVGLTPGGANVPLIAGAHILATGSSGPPAPTHGYVTSAGFSPNLNRYVALGLVQDGRARLGECVQVFDRGAVHRATICAPCAWDPTGKRMHE